MSDDCNKKRQSADLAGAEFLKRRAHAVILQVQPRPRVSDADNDVCGNASDCRSRKRNKSNRTDCVSRQVHQKIHALFLFRVFSWILLLPWQRLIARDVCRLPSFSKQHHSLSSANYSENLESLKSVYTPL